MFKVTTTPLKNSGVLNSLVADYLNGKKELTAFYDFFSDVNGFRKLLSTNPYSHFDHANLSEILKSQSKNVNNTSEATLANINLLSSKNSFTVTTGHQLCLFTGPLYFIYKIFSTINLAETLQHKFPEHHFVPVYWMASEDHDFEEINHFHINGKKFVWDSKAVGAVGDFNTSEIKKIIPALKETLGLSSNSKTLLALFEDSYLRHENLADATRFLVNELFGKYGVVIVDGNDRAFKLQFTEHFKNDIFKNTGFHSVNESIAQLKKLDYHAQVNPRLINCFYIDKELRARIENEGENYRVTGTELLFGKDEMELLIKNNPEKISPNVILRPMYQQKILPNIAYVGGPGELAYWLELKNLFDAEDIQFPILMPRNFITLIDRRTDVTIEKLGIQSSDIFKQEIELLKELQTKSDLLFELSKEELELKNIYEKIKVKTNEIDTSLNTKVAAELQKSLNALENIVMKANRAQRRKMEEEKVRIQKIKAFLFPNSIPQERYENFAAFYLTYGDNFFSILKKHAQAFEQEQILVIEE